MRLKEIMVSLSCCCAHAFPARAFPDMCFETCEAEGTQPSVFKPTAFSPKSSFLIVMTLPRMKTVCHLPTTPSDQQATSIPLPVLCSFFWISHYPHCCP